MTTIKKFHLQDNPIPDGFRIYEAHVDVAGLHHRRKDAIAFCRSGSTSIRLAADPNNPHDANAIRVIGEWRGFMSTNSKDIGFIPAAFAERIATLGIAPAILPRLLKTYVGADDYVEIAIQLLGPVDSYLSYSPPKVTAEKAAQTLYEDGNPDAAIAGLLAEIETHETENATYGVSARPYAALANIYKKEKRLEDEYLALERFIIQRRANGAQQDKLAARFLKARVARDKRLLK